MFNQNPACIKTLLILANDSIWGRLWYVLWTSNTPAIPANIFSWCENTFPKKLGSKPNPVEFILLYLLVGIPILLEDLTESIIFPPLLAELL